MIVFCYFFLHFPRKFKSIVPKQTMDKRRAWPSWRSQTQVCNSGEVADLRTSRNQFISKWQYMFKWQNMLDKYILQTSILIFSQLLSGQLVAKFSATPPQKKKRTRYTRRMGQKHIPIVYSRFPEDTKSKIPLKQMMIYFSASS